VFGTAPLTLNTTAFTLVHGLSTTINVPPNSEVFISADGGVSTVSTQTGASVAVDLVLTMDGNLFASGGFKRVTATNVSLLNSSTTTVVGITNWSLALSAAPTPGNHTFAVFAAWSPGGGALPFSNALAIVSGDGSSAMQGQLTVVIVKK
jgi:hypothetical protein